MPPSTASAPAVLHPDDFHNLLETIPSLGRRILATLARWFRQTPSRDS
jgi:hypothetical protein